VAKQKKVTGSFSAGTNGLRVELSESAFSGLPSRLALVGLSSPKRTHVSSRCREAYAIGLSAIGHLTRTGYITVVGSLLRGHFALVAPRSG